MKGINGASTSCKIFRRNLMLQDKVAKCLGPWDDSMKRSAPNRIASLTYSSATLYTKSIMHLIHTISTQNTQHTPLQKQVLHRERTGCKKPNIPQRRREIFDFSTSAKIPAISQFTVITIPWSLTAKTSHTFHSYSNVARILEHGHANFRADQRIHSRLWWLRSIPIEPFVRHTENQRRPANFLAPWQKGNVAEHSVLYCLKLSNDLVKTRRTILFILVTRFAAAGDARKENNIAINISTGIYIEADVYWWLTYLAGYYMVRI